MKLGSVGEIGERQRIEADIKWKLFYGKCVFMKSKICLNIGGFLVKTLVLHFVNKNNCLS